MPPRVAEPEAEQTPLPETVAAPCSLADAYATVIAYVRQSNPNARRFRFVYEDDEGQRGVLPVTSEVEENPDDDLTPKQQAIRQAVLETPRGELLTNDDIAKKSGWTNTRDLQDFVRFLARAGLLKPAKRGWKRS